MYAEDLHFLIKRAGWLVTFIYEHFTFEQIKFKRDFVTGNQKARLNATSSVEKDFYELLNNSNFGIDCHNNIDNCILEPLYDNLNEILNILKNLQLSLTTTHLQEEVIQNFQGKVIVLNKNDPTHEARKEYDENAMEEQLDAVESFEKDKRKGRKRKFQEIREKINDCLDLRKTKMIVEFNDHESASIKSFAVKKRNFIKVTSCFLSGKLPMFAKLSLKSFIYELSEAMCLPDETFLNIYRKYNTERVEIFHILTDTNSTSLKFIFICDPNSDVPDSKFRDVIFEVIVASKIYKRFDTSHEFWSVFCARKPHKPKKIDYYEIEHIDDLCILTLAVNPKEYHEVFKRRYLDKKHKGIKDLQGLVLRIF